MPNPYVTRLTTSPSPTSWSLTKPGRRTRYGWRSPRSFLCIFLFRLAMAYALLTASSEDVVRCPRVQERRHNRGPPSYLSSGESKSNLRRPRFRKGRPQQGNGSGNKRGCRAGPPERERGAVDSETGDLVPRRTHAPLADRGTQVRLADRPSAKITGHDGNDSRIARDGGTSQRRLIPSRGHHDCPPPGRVIECIF